MDSTARKQCYKELIERGMVLHREMSTKETSVNAVEQVSNLISESNRLNGQTAPTDHVNNTAEVVMDAQVMKMGHDILGEIVNKVCSSEFSTEEYCTAILNHLAKSGNGTWDSFEKLVTNQFSLQNYSCSLLGSFDINTSSVTEKLVKKRQLSQTQSKLTRPEAVKKSSEENKGMEKLNIILSTIVMLYKDNNQKPIPYYKLIIDRTDMMKTINNAFQIAFLVSNGSLAIEVDSNDLPLVKPIIGNRNLQNAEGCAQAVSTITKEICEEMIAYYKIKEPLLKYDF